MVGVNAWVIHTDENIWGKDVHEFRPERWLVDKEQVNFMDQNYLAVSVFLKVAGIRDGSRADTIYSLEPAQEHASAKTSRSLK